MTYVRIKLYILAIFLLGTFVIINSSPAFAISINHSGDGFFKVGSMLVPRVNHSAILLNDGRIFISGGTNWDKLLIPKFNEQTVGAYYSTEIYDPKTNTSVVGPDMSVPRMNHSLTKLSDGKILIAGGVSDNAASTKQGGSFYTGYVEIFDPQTNTITDGPMMSNLYSDFQIVDIGSGKYLFADDLFSGVYEYKAEIYNENTNIFTDYSEEYNISDECLINSGIRTDKEMNFDRMRKKFNVPAGNFIFAGAYVVVLSENKMLLINSYTGDIYTYCPKTKANIAVAHPNVIRGGFAFLQLDEDNILFVGGSGSNSAEIYNIPENQFTLLTSTLGMAVVRNNIYAQSQMQQINAERILVAGSTYMSPETPISIFNPQSKQFELTKYTEPAVNGVFVRLENGSFLYLGGDVLSGMTSNGTIDGVYIYKIKVKKQKN